MRSRGYAAEDRTRKAAAFTEVRVHGVGGTAPENLLDHPNPEQVAGDNISGFYRRPDNDELEAYSWGGLTSRSGARSLWLLLLPFGLANVAGWMLGYRPSGVGADPPRSATRLKALLRLFALGVTVVYVLWIGQIALDLIAYQCGGQDACFSSRWWLRFFDLDFFQGNPARRLAAGMVIPLLLVLTLQLVGRSSRSRYEAKFEEEAASVRGAAGPTRTEEPKDDPALKYGLADGPFWHSTKLVERLARLHVAGALAAVAAVTSFSLWRLERTTDAGFGDNLRMVFFLATSALFVLIALAVVTVARRKSGYVLLLLAVSVASVAIVAIDALTRSGPDVGVSSGPPTPQILPGYGRFGLAATFIVVLLAIVLLVLLWGDTGRRETKKHTKAQGLPTGFYGGFGPFAAATAAAVLLAGVLAGSIIRVADWLGDSPEATPDPCACPARPIVDYSSGYDWFSLIAAGLIIFIAITAAGRVLLLACGRKGWRRTEALEKIDEEYRSHPQDPRPTECIAPHEEPCVGGDSVAARPCLSLPWKQKPQVTERDGFLLQISRQRRIRSAVGIVDRYVFRLILLILAAALGSFVFRFFSALSGDQGNYLQRFFNDLPEVPGWLQSLVSPATWLVTAIPLVFLLALQRSFSNPTVRRRTGIVWDVITFWPRWYHPLAPPSYAARAIPQLAIRLDLLTKPTDGADPGTAVLSAHSQGAVVGAATMMRLPRQTRDRVALLTHGSPVRHLYGKFFPAYFGPDDLEQLASLLCRGNEICWRNLYRLTDPIGGATFGEVSVEWSNREHGPPMYGAVDRLIPDPLTDRHLPGDPCPAPQGHSGYFSGPPKCGCPPYDEARRQLRDCLRLTPSPDAAHCHDVIFKEAEEPG